jgi:hypothetical protein
MVRIGYALAYVLLLWKDIQPVRSGSIGVRGGVGGEHRQTIN